MRETAIKPSTCFRHKEIFVADLKHEMQRVRGSLGSPFDDANESFDDYMARVAALDNPSVPTQTDASIHQDELVADLIEGYPHAGLCCPDLEYRTLLVDACRSLAKAEEAVKQHNSEEGWFFLSVAKERLGRADGYYEVRSHQNMKTSRARSGGEQKAKNTKNKERILYIRLLKALAPEQGWKSELDAIKKVSEEAAPIIELFNLSVGDVYANFSEALKSDAGVKAALEQKMQKRSG